MKKLSLLLAAAMTISLSACDNMERSSVVEDENQSTTMTDTQRMDQNTANQNSSEYIDNVDVDLLDSYSYDRKDDFISYIDENLNEVDQQIQEIEQNIQTAQVDPEVKENFNNLKTKKQEVEQELQQLGNVQQDEWEQHRSYVNSILESTQIYAEIIQDKVTG